MSSSLLTAPDAAHHPSVVEPERTAILSCQRREFRIPRGTHYLNCAYMGPLSRAVEAAAVQAVRRQRDPSAIAPSDYFSVPDRLRAAFARLVNVLDPRRVAIVSSVSYAMATAVRNVPLSAGDNVVVIGDEFPSAVLAWRRAAVERGATLRTVAAPMDVAADRRAAVWNARLHDAIDARTAAVVLAHAHWCDGTVFDVIRLARRAHDVGAAVLIDGTQSIGALPFDVSVVQPDLLVTTGYKWLMGPYGLSVAYIGPRFDDGQPIEEVWTSQLGSDVFARLTDYRDAYRELGARYDGGERASFVLAPMLTAAIEQLLRWGVGSVQRYCADLIRPWRDALFGDPDDTGRAAHLIGVRVRGDDDVTRAAERLREKGVHVSVRGEVVRVSPNVYNGPDDLEALCAGLRPR